ncbi:MAG TPA: Crp/Fnr family transcriptional regulator [Solirubrobacteraceae bacterium]|jgi:CRP-like cAMP-binding protein|nr:Crp/Fnr family transcriptional regulator [Solirubrobacteraceae bacterium]
MATALAPTPTFIQSLLERERVDLLATGRARRWQAAETLVRRGDRADSAIVLLAGLVKIHTSVQGAEVLLGLSGPGDLLGEATATAGARDAVRSATVTGLEPVEGVVIAVPSLRAFLAEHPRATLALLDLALGRLYIADARRMEFATSESLARVAGRLVELAERFGVQGGDGSIDVALPITQEELASWSASSRESTARALRTLRRLRLIETYRRGLTVLDLDGLRSHTPQL